MNLTLVAHRRRSLAKLQGYLARRREPTWDLDDGVVYTRADRIEMAIDFGIVGPFVRLQVIPEAHPACAQQGGNDQRQD